MKRLLVISMCLALTIGFMPPLANSGSSASTIQHGNALAVRDQTGSISGHVYEADGVTPIANMYICAFNAATGEDAGCNDTATDGSYNIQLPAGTYYVHACSFCPGFDYINEWYDGVYYESQATPVTVVEGQDTPDIDFFMEIGGSISGHVYEDDGVTPIVGLHMWADDPIMDESLSMGQTQDDGSYRIPGLPQGDYRVHACAPCAGLDYVDEWYDDVYDDEDATLVPVVPPNDTPNIDFLLDQGGTISGQVYQSDGMTPIVNLHLYAVNVTTDEQLPGTNTREDGSYTLRVPTGSYLVRACASCSGHPYLDEWYDDVYDSDQATPVSVIEPDDTPNINFMLSSGGSISGHVYQADGVTPIEGATVEVLADRGDPVASTVTLADGSYTIPGLVSSTYAVRALAPGYAREYYDNVNFSLEATVISVVEPEDTPGIDFSLTASGSISGHIYEADGTTPVPGIEVFTRPGKYMFDDGFYATTADHGGYTVDNLALGEYRLVVETPGYAREYHDGGFCWGTQYDVVVTPPDNTPGIDINLDQAAVISGHVYESDGQTPVTDATIFAHFDPPVSGECEAPTANPDETGFYAFESLWADMYKLSIRSPGFAAEYYRGKPSDRQADELPVSVGEHLSNIDFTLDVGGTVTGHVFDAEDGRALRGIDLQIRLAEGGHVTYSGATDYEGRWTVWLGNGQYVIGTNIAPGYVHEWYEDRYDERLADPIGVVVPEVFSGIDLYLSQMSSIAGHVYTEDGETPIADAEVFAFSTAAEFGTGANTAADGSYQIEGLPSGWYRVSAGVSGYIAEYYDDVLDPRQATLARATPAGQTGIDFVLEPSALDGPIGLALDQMETRAYVVEEDSGELSQVELDSGVTTVVASGLAAPWGIALNGDETAAYVTEGNAGRLVQVDISSAQITSIATGLAAPRGVALDASETVAYVAEVADGRLSRVDLATGVVTTITDRLAEPMDAVLDGTDTVAYVTESGSGTLLHIDLSSGVTTVVATGLESPVGLALNTAETHAYVVEAGSGCLSRVDLATGEKTILAEGLHSPRGVAITADESLAVVTELGIDSVTLVDIARKPDLTASTKMVDKTTARPDEMLTYTIVLENDGEVDATAASLSDPIPTHTTYISGTVTGGATYNPATDAIEWSGTVAIATPVTITFQVQLDSPLPDGTVILNRVTVRDGVNPPFDKVQRTIARGPKICTVTSTANSGPGTLREALLDAVSGDAITFDPAVFPPGAPATIALTSPLPDITQGNLTIDGTDAGVIIDGSGIAEDAHCLCLNSDGNTVRGLRVGGCAWGGVTVLGADNTVTDNVLFGSGAGVVLGGTAAYSNTVTGSYIGTDAEGAAGLGNGIGVFIDNGAHDNTVGGYTPAERNVISGNEGGVAIFGSVTDGNLVVGNYIGVDASGTAALPNDCNGMDIRAPNNTIGGLTPDARNVVSGNGCNGIMLAGSDSRNNTVVGNYIGTDASGTGALPNSYHGVAIQEGAANNTVAGNVIAHNHGNGVMVGGSDSIGNTISRNSITANGGVGIDNVDGGNTELTPPTIASASCNSVSGTAPLDSTVEIFSDPADEGKTYEGTTTADATGAFTWAGSISGPNVTATATDGPGNTSEFSMPSSDACYRIYLPLITKNYQ